MKVTIHQPEHLPWLGFFHKVNMADVYVVLDNVQFTKNYFQNRNKIRGANGASWLTVPVRYEFGQDIIDVLIDNSSSRWKRKYWESISYAYKKSPFFDTYALKLKTLLDLEWLKVCDLNLALIFLFLEFLGISRKVLKASELGVAGSGSDLLLEICRKTGATSYISGVSGRDYLSLDNFAQAGIEVVFQEFHHPIYKQLKEPFLPCLSVIDLLFNHGPESLKLINGVNVAVMEKLFL